MEYLIGSFGTILGIFMTLLIVRKANLAIPVNQRLVVRQSKTHELIKHYYYYVPQHKELKTQATDHFDRVHARVVILDGVAYWIQNNSLLCATMVDGIIDESSTKVVDTMALNKVELEKVILVVDKLTEGTTNDNRNPGDSQF